jgi:5-methylcytosine-specific restriction endonuclease McrA
MLTEESRWHWCREFSTKWCQRCGKEYVPTVGYQKYCKECGPIEKHEREAKEATARRVTYYKTHPEQEKKRQARSCKTHSEKRAEAQARYGRSHPMVSRLKDAKRRSLKYANTPISEMLTSTEWLAILAEYDGHCAYCDKEAKLTLDHVIPLSKGGTHSKENVVPACAHCNSSKGNKTLEEWNAKRLTQTKN